MTGILISGVNGRMGSMVAEIASSRKDCFVCAGMDINTAKKQDFMVFAPGEYEGQADVIIDASYIEGTAALLEYAIRRNLPLVIMTTGQNEEQMALIKEASAKIPIFKSGNMSVGINILSALVKKTAEILGETFDIEIVEAHHNKKVDAPSGTAMMLAQSASDGLSETPVYTYDRHLQRKPRDHEEIGIHSIRGGTIIGEHEVIFAGEDEVIKLSHSAGSRKMFAAGAVNAALFLIQQNPGFYDMNDLIRGRI
jgi:4-hydroxy-tetrahydrodipicolinate reductase